MGTSPWPLKLMRQFRYEHFGFISMLVALVILPWAITLAFCPAAVRRATTNRRRCCAAGQPIHVLLGNRPGAGAACFVRIGVSLTYGILCSVGAAVGVIMPMIIKASGVFQKAPISFRCRGLIILFGMAIMVLGVVFASLAGAGRERMLNQTGKRLGRTAITRPIGRRDRHGDCRPACCRSDGDSHSPIARTTIIKAMMAHGAAGFPARISVWAIALSGAVLPNVLYPAFLMTRNASWRMLDRHTLGTSGSSVIYGVLFFTASVLLGEGTLLMGRWGRRWARDWSKAR